MGDGNAIFISADQDTNVNLTLCKFENVTLTNMITSSTAVFDRVTAINVNGTFIDAESSSITIRSSTFDDFYSSNGYLL